VETLNCAQSNPIVRHQLTGSAITRLYNRWIGLLTPCLKKTVQTYFCQNFVKFRPSVLLLLLCHKLGEVENEYTAEKLVFSAILVPKIITIGLNLTKF